MIDIVWTLLEISIHRYLLRGVSYLLMCNHTQKDSVASSSPVKYQIASYLQCVLVLYCITHYPRA